MQKQTFLCLWWEENRQLLVMVMGKAGKIFNTVQSSIFFSLNFAIFFYKNIFNIELYLHANLNHIHLQNVLIIAHLSHHTAIPAGSEHLNSVTTDALAVLHLGLYVPHQVTWRHQHTKTHAEYPNRTVPGPACTSLTTSRDVTSIPKHTQNVPTGGSWP